MGAYAEKWRRNWGSFWSQYSGRYAQAAECSETRDGLDAMECAVEVMKGIKRDRMSAGGKGGRAKAR